MRGYTRAVSGQRLGEHVPVATQQILNNETVGLQQWKRGIPKWSVPRSYVEDNWGKPVSSVRESVKKLLEPEAEEEPLLGPLPGNV
jgi:hypothetical protein